MTGTEINDIKKGLRERREGLRDQRKQTADHIYFIGDKLRAIIQHEHGQHDSEPNSMCLACT